MFGATLDAASDWRHFIARIVSFFIIIDVRMVFYSDFVENGAEDAETADELRQKLRAANAKQLDINNKDSIGRTMLDIAVESGKILMARELIAAGARFGNDPRRPKPEDWALMMNYVLQYAEVNDLRLFVRAGIDLKSFMESHPRVFFDAVSLGRHVLVVLLIAAGADVNAKDARNNLTSLMMATVFGHMEVAKLLIAAGADVNAKTARNETALILTCAKGRVEMVKMLIAAGAEVNMKGGDLTALAMASIEGHVEVVKLLIAAGAGADAGAEERTAALALARAQGHTEIVKLLIEADASN